MREHGMTERELRAALEHSDEYRQLTAGAGKIRGSSDPPDHRGGASADFPTATTANIYFAINRQNGLV